MPPSERWPAGGAKRTRPRVAGGDESSAKIFLGELDEDEVTTLVCRLLRRLGVPSESIVAVREYPLSGTQWPLVDHDLLQNLYRITGEGERRKLMELMERASTPGVPEHSLRPHQEHRGRMA